MTAKIIVKYVWYRVYDGGKISDVPDEWYRWDDIKGEPVHLNGYDDGYDTEDAAIQGLLRYADGHDSDKYTLVKIYRVLT